MKEIKRYKITNANGNSSNVTQCDSGHWVHYSEIEQLQARVTELEVVCANNCLFEIEIKRLNWLIANMMTNVEDIKELEYDK